MTKYLNTNPIPLLSTYVNGVKNHLEINQRASYMKKYVKRDQNYNNLNYRISLKKLKIVKKILKKKISCFELQDKPLINLNTNID